jgi:predicted ester cyclase
MSTSSSEMDIRQRMSLKTSPELHEQIRRLWIQHSIAEDNHDIPGLMKTLAPDCVYEIVPTGDRWEGIPGATRFYTELLTAFPDVHFDLAEIVIGPQGVFEVANVTGTFQDIWVGIPPTGKPAQFQVIIYFPWNPSAELFAGEKIWVDTRSFLQQAQS